MEYGILVAESAAPDFVSRPFQVLGPVESLEDAKRHVREYLQWANPDVDIAADRYVIHRRNVDGSYVIRETIDLENIGA